jgi:outer membrane receptor for ferrienterochelin and colicins
MDHTAQVLAGAQTKLRRLLAIIPLATAALQLLVAFRADAQDPGEGRATDEQVLLQEIPSVYAASKYEQKVTEAPSSVSIITADEIKKYGYRTLADILRSVRGLTVTYDRNYSYIGVRGFSRSGDYNARVLIMVDGHRLNDPVYDGVIIGTDFVLDVDLIDRIEIVRGPSSSLYGNNALFGVINVITRRGRDFQGVEGAGSVGSFSTYTARLSGGYRFQNGLEPVLSGSYLSSHGQSRLFFPEFAEPGVSDGIARDRDGDRAYQLFAKSAWRDFTLTAAYNRRTKEVPTASFETVFDEREETVDSQGFIDLAYDHAFGPAWRVSGRLAYDRYYYRGLYPYAGENGSIVKNIDPALGEAVGGELQVSTTVLPRNRLTLGSDFRYSFSLDQDNFNESPFFRFLRSRETGIHWGIYAQDEVTLLSNLILNAGIRYDHYDSFGSTVNPRLALIYTPWKTTTFKALYGTAFRAPNAYERFYVSPTIKMNPDLGPEKITTYELIAEQAIGANLRGTVVGFYYKLDDVINLVTDPEDGLEVFRNSGSIQAKGVELELEGRWANGVSGRVSYTYQDAEDASSGRPAPGSAAHLAKVNVILPLWRERLFLGLEGQYQSRRALERGGSLKDFFIANVTLFSVSLPVKGLDLSASVYNVLDTRYRDPVGAELRQTGIEQDGRTFRLKLTYAY